MPVFFFLLLVSYILGNIYIFVRGFQALEHFPLVYRVIFSIIYLTGSFLFLLIMVFRDSKHIPASLGHVLYQVGSGWLIFVLYMVVFLACTDLIKVFNHSFQYGFHIALLLTCSLLLYGYLNFQHTFKQVINISVNKPLLDGDRLKIVAISDLHLGFGSNINRLRKDIDRINAENPDLILIAGDLIDNSIVPVVEQRMDKELNRLHARLGVYMAPGNHEYISGFTACRDFLRSTSIQLLRDSMVTLPCGLQIIGRDDYSNRNRLPASNWANLAVASKPTVILDHQPQHLDEALQIRADLQISGHTHNGQVIPIKFLTDYLFELSYGYQKKDQTHYYVTSGLALWGPPLRIGSQCEMVVFECTFAKE